jgi:hypothetical protein
VADLLSRGLNGQEEKARNFQRKQRGEQLIEAAKKLGKIGVRKSRPGNDCQVLSFITGSHYGGKFSLLLEESHSKNDYLRQIPALSRV